MLLIFSFQDNYSRAKALKTPTHHRLPHCLSFTKSQNPHWAIESDRPPKTNEKTLSLFQENLMNSLLLIMRKARSRLKLRSYL